MTKEKKRRLECADEILETSQAQQRRSRACLVMYT